MRSRCRLQHVALNVAKFVYMQKNQELRDDVLTADIIGIDGMGIVLAARQFGIKVPQRVAGVDLMERLLEACAAKGYHPYFLGATGEALSRALHNLRIRFPNLEIAGAHHGYYPRESEADVVAAIRASGADCLFIGMPTPHKERFLATHRDTIGVPFIMGVGGSIDIIAQITKRAPVWMQWIGLEWLSHHASAAQDVEAVPHDKYCFCRHYRQGGVPALIAPVRTAFTPGDFVFRLD